MILREYQIIDEINDKSAEELLEVAKSVVDKAKYLLIECTLDCYDITNGILYLKSVMNLMDNEETGNIVPVMVLAMGDNLLEDNHLSIKVRFFDEKPNLRTETLSEVFV